MTKASEVTVTDEEVSAIYKFCDEIDAREDAPKPREIFRQALAAFLAARVPDAWDENDWQCAETHNALRAAVLRGPG